MGTKLVSAKLPQETIDYLNRKHENMTQGIIECAKFEKIVKKTMLLDIRNVFTPEEWLEMARSFNGTKVTIEFRFNRPAFLVHMKDYVKLECGDQELVNSIESKVNKLTHLHLDAIYTRIEEFWNSENTNALEWANY
jgi:hypothetical protein